MSRRIAVTGAAGHLGRAVVARLLDEPDVEELVAVDCADLPRQDSRVRAVRCDVRDPSLVGHLAGCDALAHLAFVVEEDRGDKARAVGINVDGSLAVVRAAAAAGVGHVVYTSSLVAYGFHPENEGRVLDEGAPLRGNLDFTYAACKASVERWLDRIEAELPEKLAICRLRPSAFLAPGAQRAIAAPLRGPLFACPVGRADPAVHVTHQEDVAQAVVLALRCRARGAFNLAAAEPLPLSRWGAAMGKPSLALPSLTPRLLAMSYRLGLTSIDPAWYTVAARHPIVVDSGRAQRELGWRPVFSTTAVVLRAIACRPAALAGPCALSALGDAALATRRLGAFADGTTGLPGTVNLELGGATPSEWHLTNAWGRLGLTPGLAPRPAATLSLTEETLEALLAGGLGPRHACPPAAVGWDGQGDPTALLDALALHLGPAARRPRGGTSWRRHALHRLAAGR